MKTFTRVLTVLALLAVTVLPQQAPARAAGMTWSGRADARGTDWVAHKFRIDTPGTISATLTWASTANLNLHLRDPHGTIVQSSVLRHGKRETVELAAGDTGVWTLGVKAREGAAAYTVEASVSNNDAAVPPPVDHGGTGWVGHTRGWTIENEANGHTWTDAQAVADAKAVDVIVALPGSYRGQVDMMRRANPGLVLLNYINGVYAQPRERDAYPASWYLRDRHGNKIQNNWNLWMMDPSNPSWIANRAEECAKRIVATGYDGCSLDNLGYGTLGQGAHPVNSQTGRLYSDAEWIRHTANLAAAVRKRIAPATLAINGLMNGVNYFGSPAPARSLLQSADAGIAEIFVRTSRQGLGSYRSESQWKADVDMLVDASAIGSRVLAVTKVWLPASQAQKDAWHQYAFATFLLGDDGNHRFTFSGARYEDTTDAHPWWSPNLGPPRGGYFAEAGVYQRLFANGRVLVNPTSKHATVTLPAPLRDIGGTWRSTVELPRNTGRILTGG